MVGWTWAVERSELPEFICLRFDSCYCLDILAYEMASSAAAETTIIQLKMTLIRALQLYCSFFKACVKVGVVQGNLGLRTRSVPSINTSSWLPSHSSSTQYLRFKQLSDDSLLTTLIIADPIFGLDGEVPRGRCELWVIHQDGQWEAVCGGPESVRRLVTLSDAGRKWNAP